ncbi:hypothetical protein E4Z66_01385 [Aliishimia ponticola]|uniref:DUF8173 domain-containing protein n=1 Tax=Aliishimia ponticola TaxID=2499833 RepID=A0A4S4NFA5_9RHOB|nr:hypothetical protein [Aliishimia ponticola]THH38256.1 hypothetical protein E4Z66_01385 [Aliishimia ponticola]
MTRILACFFLILTSSALLAEERPAIVEMGGDVFQGGRVVTHDAEGTDDLFMAGARVTGKRDIAGSAHLAGRKIVMDGEVQGDAYAFGEEVALNGAVTGDATLAGRAVSVQDVGGDLRIAGSKVSVLGDVQGYAMVAGEEVRIEGRIMGDLRLAAEEITWGDTAQIDGKLILYEDDPGETTVPGGVVAEDRIDRREIEDWDGPRPPSFGRLLGKFVLGILLVTGLAALVAALVPDRLADMRRQMLDRPFNALWIGFLALSALIGAGILVGMTVIGLLLTPAFIALAVVSGFAGYVVATYSFGVGLLLAVGRSLPESLPERILAAAIGALVAAIIGVIPFLGWLFVLALVLAGLGAITIRLLRPAFFVGAP